MTYCSECGKNISKNVKYCPICSLNTLLALSVTLQLHNNSNKGENTEQPSLIMRNMNKKIK